MNIDETMSILRIIFENEGNTYKITHISAAYGPYVANKVPTYVMIQPFISMVIFASYCIYIFMKININIRIKRKIAENEWGIPTK